MIIAICLIAYMFRATEGVETIVCGAVTSQELIILRTLHRFCLIEADTAIVDAVTGGALVAH